MRTIAYYDDMDTIKLPVLTNKLSPLQEIVKRKMSVFLLPQCAKCNSDTESSLYKNMGRCITCNNKCSTNYGSIIANCYSHSHYTFPEFFVICINCVIACTNVKTPLIRSIFSCYSDQYFSPIHPIYKTGYIAYYQHSGVMVLVNLLIINYLNIVDRYYNFNHKVTLLLIMSYYDNNSLLINIPRDIMMHALGFIYHDVM